MDKYTIVNGDIKVEIPMPSDRDLQRAQFKLDTQIMTSMEPFMPMVTGTFIALTQARSMAMAGTGYVCAGAPPYGRYLYFGHKMVDSETGRGPMKIVTADGDVLIRYRHGAKLIPTQEPLNFSKSAHPQAQARWFEAAKQVHLQNWLQVALAGILGVSDDGTD